jgi:hypothetical protein
VVERGRVRKMGQVLKLQGRKVRREWVTAMHEVIASA